MLQRLFKFNQEIIYLARIISGKFNFAQVNFETVQHYVYSLIDLIHYTDENVIIQTTTALHTQYSKLESVSV